MKARSVWLIGYRALSDCAGKASMFVITVLAARMLSQEAFGIFSVASALGWMIAVATDWGIQLHVARVVAASPASAADVLRRWLRVRLWMSAVAMAAVGIAVLGGAPAERAAVVLIAGNYIAAGLIEFLYYFLRGAGRTDLESTLTVVHRAGLLACAALALVMVRSVTALAVALLLPTLASLGAALVLARRVAVAQSATAPRSACEDGWEAERLWDQFVDQVLPIGAGIVLSALYFRIDLLLVDRWLGPAAAGQYNAVFRLVEALRLFPAAVIAVSLPSLFRAADERPLRQAALTVTVFGLGLMAAGLVAAGWLVPLLYGEGYAGTVSVFRVLLLSFPLLSLNYALTHQLIGWNGQRSYVAICGAALVANLALNAVLIPSAGIEGAAWATFWTEMLLTASCAWKLWALAPGRSSDAGVAVARA